MIRGIRCSTTILEANLSPENHRGHQITFARSTHNASSKTSPLQHLSRMKGIDLTCGDGKVNGIAIHTGSDQAHEMWCGWRALAPALQPLPSLEGRPIRRDRIRRI